MLTLRRGVGESIGMLAGRRREGCDRAEEKGCAGNFPPFRGKSDEIMKDHPLAETGKRKRGLIKKGT